MLVELRYVGLVEIKSELTPAIQFLNSIKDEQGELLGVADLVFATYDFENGMDLTCLDKLIP